MNKTILLIIGIVVIVGTIFAFKNFNNPQLPTFQKTSPPLTQVTPTPSPSKSATTAKPTAASSNALDRIEAAIRAKLKR